MGTEYEALKASKLAPELTGEQLDVRLQRLRDPGERRRERLAPELERPATELRDLAVRLREVGMVRSTPQKLIAQGTDWRFLNELKKELRGMDAAGVR